MWKKTAAVMTALLLLTGCGHASGGTVSGGDSSQPEQTDSAGTEAQQRDSDSKAQEAPASEQSGSGDAAAQNGTAASDSAAQGDAGASPTDTSGETLPAGATPADPVKQTAAEEKLTAFMNAVIAADRAAVQANTNADDYAGYCTALISQEHADTVLERLFGHLDSAGFQRYAITSAAHRDDLLPSYREHVAGIRSVGESGGDEMYSPETLNAILPYLEGVSDIYVFSLDITDKNGETASGTYPVIQRNGSWCVDIFLLESLGVSLKPLSAQTAANLIAKNVFAAMTFKAEEMEDAGVDLFQTSEQDYLWDAAALSSAAKPASTDTAEDMIAMLLYSAKEQVADFGELKTIRARISDGYCWCIAVETNDGTFGCYPVQNEKIYSSIDEAFDDAKATRYQTN